MRYRSVRELRNYSGKIKEALKDKEEVVITSNGKPIALMIAVDEASLEEEVEAYRRAKAQMAIERMQRAAVSKEIDRMTIEDINEIITETRKERKR